MENPTKAIRATLRTIIAIATTSMMESRLAMRQFLEQSSDGVDLDHAVPHSDSPARRQEHRQRVRVVGRRRRYHFATCQRQLSGPNSRLVSVRISRHRQSGGLPTSA
jgi:hypothetical protein